MPRTRKSQRKLDRKEARFEPYARTTDSRIYIGYFGDLLSRLDQDFQNNQQRVKHELGRKLAASIDEWRLTPRDPVSARKIFELIQRHENRDFWGHGTAHPLPIQHSEYMAFTEVSERLAFGYIDYANYYLQKQQRESLASGVRYHSSYHIPVQLVYFEDRLLSE